MIWGSKKRADGGWKGETFKNREWYELGIKVKGPKITWGAGEQLV